MDFVLKDNIGLMGEPIDIDTVVDPRRLTADDKKSISDFIKADKLKRARLPIQYISRHLNGYRMRSMRSQRFGYTET
jgi:hypothetical protein